jgi:hypothetical protein
MTENSNRFGIWSIGYYLGFMIWYLVFGIVPAGTGGTKFRPPWRRGIEGD